MAFPGEGGGARRGKRRRLSRSAEFDRVFREGRSHASRYLVLHAFPRPHADEEEPRLGVSVGRKVGGAVERNRVKRLLREAFSQRTQPLADGQDVVLVARPDIKELAQREGVAGVARALDELVEKAGLDGEPAAP